MIPFFKWLCRIEKKFYFMIQSTLETDFLE